MSVYCASLTIASSVSEYPLIKRQILAIQGYVGVSTMALAAPPTDGSPTIATLSLISRLGWKRAGTRFNTRGVDDDGNTANFVEVRMVTPLLPEPSLSSKCSQTETVFSTDQQCISYVQVRGSVPCMYSPPNKICFSPSECRHMMLCSILGTTRSPNIWPAHTNNSPTRLSARIRATLRSSHRRVRCRARYQPSWHQRK